MRSVKKKTVLKKHNTLSQVLMSGKLCETVFVHDEGNGSGEEEQRETGVECLFKRAPATPAATTLLQLFL